MKRWGALLLLSACAARGSFDAADDPNAPPARADAGVDASDVAPPPPPPPEQADASPPPRCDPSKPFDAPVAIAELDTTDQETVADVSPDELTLYFGSNRGTSGGMHLFYATRTSPTAQFGARTALFTNGAYDDWSVAVTGDGLTAVLSSDRGGNDDLFVATRASALSVFGAPSPASATNSTSNEATPRWSADGKTLWFDSSRGGHREIWRASVAGGTLGSPERVAELSSGTLEAGPVVSADELTIYFLSTRAPTTDGDIYVATRAKRSDLFSNVHPLANVNSPGIDVPAHVTSDGCVLYLSSTRSAVAAGVFDMFVARRPK